MLESKNLALCVCDMDISNNKIVCWKDIDLTDDTDFKCSYSCNSIMLVFIKIMYTIVKNTQNKVTI